MIYAFVLGRVYTLAIAEVLSVVEDIGLVVKNISASEEVLLVEFENVAEVDILKLQKRLGGTVKVLKLHDAISLSVAEEKPTAEFFVEALEKIGVDFTFRALSEALQIEDKKCDFGVSVYSLDPQISLSGIKLKSGNPVQKLGLALKKILKNGGVASRVVLPENNFWTLTSATVWHNKLAPLSLPQKNFVEGKGGGRKGVELCILLTKKVAYIATTLTVQDFEDYGRRDFQRPVRDMQRGLTPPKVAQVMLNLAGRLDVSLGVIPTESASGGIPPLLKAFGRDDRASIWDPFCGLGTFVQEGLLLGFQMVGSDIDPKAVLGSQKNIEWLCNRYNLPKNYDLFPGDAGLVADSVFKAREAVQAIVTEGTLGPVFGHFPTSDKIEQVFADLASLYSKCFASWYKNLPNLKTVVMCLPAYRKSGEEYALFPSLDFALKNGYTQKDLISQNLAFNWPFLRLTERNTAIYDRKDQVVAREIVIFEK